MKKKYSFCLIVILCLSFLFICFFSYKDSNKKSNEDDLIIAAYINGELSSSFPTTNDYVGNVSCDNNATGYVTWNGTKYVFNVTNITSGKIKCNAFFATDYYMFADNSGANTPNLDTNMIPVVYDNEDDTWIKAPATQIGWYNYDNQIWANAVTIVSDKRDTYKSAAIGSPILMDDIAGMFVWIPRYEYQYTNLGTNFAGGTLALPGPIEIKFINGTSTTSNSNYIIHPVFRNGSNTYNILSGSTVIAPGSSSYQWGGWSHELSGFWLAKFETTYDGNIASVSSHNESLNLALTAGIRIKPNFGIIRNISVSDAFTTAQNVYNDHGLTSSMISHMTKNDEWGAVSYLTQSIYGKYGNINFSNENKEVYVNNGKYSISAMVHILTGRSSGFPGGSNGTTSDFGTYEYNNCNARPLNSTNVCSYSERLNNNNKGTGASTTGNIYGVYDMAGGSQEFLMANYNNLVSSSGFSSMPDQMYYNKYTTTSMSNACNGQPCYGQALSETGNGLDNGAYQFYLDNMTFISNSYPWPRRGSDATGVSSQNCGIFDMVCNTGEASCYVSFRITLT